MQANVERKVWIKTFGCQMNYHDTERVLAQLSDLNFSVTEKQSEADLILFNTCAVRELANLKFYSALGETKTFKHEGKWIGVFGCVAQIDAEKLLKKYGHLDFAFGTDALDGIKEMVFRLENGERKFCVTKEDKTQDYSIETKITHGSPQAFVNIMKGCDNFCTYCIVPFTRGREKSRKTDEIIEDITNLVQNKGVSEITLLGQNVNSFGKKNGESFPELLKRINDIDGVRRIRYTTSHPYDMSDDLIEAHRTLAKLENHLHLPVQSGSNSVLKRMNRRYSREHYLERIETLKKAVPGITLSTDIIVGFPGETQEEFDDTMTLLDSVQYDFIFSFNYSPRSGTKAFNMEDNVPFEEKRQRLYKLQQHQLKIQENIRKVLVGEEFEVLVEGLKEKKGRKQYFGRTSCNRLIHFDATAGRDLTWKWVKVKVDKATALALQGTLIDAL